MAMKTLSSQEQMFIFNLLERSNCQIKEAKAVSVLMDKLDHNLSETIKKEQAPPFKGKSKG